MDKGQVSTYTCPECGAKVSSSPLPSEKWAPYRFLWERVGPCLGLPRQPWTWTMRENPGRYFALLVPLLVLAVVKLASRPWALAVICFGGGMLTGHVFW